MIGYLRQLPPHARVVAVGILALGTCLMLYAIISLSTWFWNNQQQIQELEPRIARLQGYTQSEDLLQSSVRELESQLADIAYPAGEDSASTGAALQQQVRRYMEAAGLNVSGSQVLAVLPHDGFEELRVTFNATGSMEALDQLLLDLQQARPALMIHALRLNPGRTPRGDSSQVISFSITISAVKLL